MKTKLLSALLSIVLITSLATPVFAANSSEDLYGSRSYSTRGSGRYSNDYYSDGDYYVKRNYTGERPEMRYYDDDYYYDVSRWFERTYYEYGSPYCYDDPQYTAITRGEMAITFYSALEEDNLDNGRTSGRTSSRYRQSFTDLRRLDEEAIDILEYLYSKGAVDGYPDGTFQPGEPVTREEAITFLVKILDSYNVRVRGNGNRNVSFDDVEDDRWSIDYIYDGVSMGLMQGTGRNFEPDRYISLEELWTVYDNLLDVISGLTEDGVAEGLRSQFMIDFSFPIRAGYPDDSDNNYGDGFSKSSYTVKVGFSTTLTYNGRDAYDFESSDPRTVSVNTSGKVTGIKEGTVTISALDRNGREVGRCRVTSSRDGSGGGDSSGEAIYFEDPTTKTFTNVGAQVNLQAEMPTGGNAVVSIYSSNDNVVRVIDEKTLLIIGTGECYITVSDKYSNSASRQIIVK